MKKYENLRKILNTYGKICVAYSGGTDSDFLLNAAVDILGSENVIAIIADGIMLARKDYEDAVQLAKKAGAKYYTVTTDAFSEENFAMNRHKRCYYCKKNIMTGLIKKANSLGFDVIADGKNTDDGKVYRPGAQAAEELGIVSPLFEAKFSKEEIRQCGKKMGLETWNKKSNSCLATRFPYDTQLTREMFEKVEKAEKIIFDNGFIGARVRLHGDIARIEIDKKDFERFITNTAVAEKIKAVGFKYITLDLEGFRSGSMD